MPATSADNYVDVDGETDCDLADLNAAHKLMGRIKMKRNFTELQKPRRRAGDVVPTSMRDVVSSLLERGSPFFAGETS